MSKRCFLYAYDKQNLGDDLFVHTICKRYPNVQFYMWSNIENRKTFCELHNLCVVNQNSLLVYGLKKIRDSLVPRYRHWLENRCDAMVYIGGSLFIEYKEWEKLLTWWEYEAINRSFYVMGANFGPYKDEEYRKKLAYIFSFMKDICFRDNYSLMKFVDVPTVRYAPDILFGQQMPSRKKTEKRVLFSVIDCAGKGEGINQFADFEESYLSLICDMVHKSWQRGYNPVLASFCKQEGDEAAIEKIKDKLAPKFRGTLETIKYSGTNSEKILQTISDADFVVASRFHAAILGFDAGKPVLPVVYSDKTLHVLEDAGFDGTVLDLRHLEQDSGAFEAMLNNPQKQILVNIEQLRKQSEGHFTKLDEVMRQ